jgi:hypothetical protein
MLPGVASLLGDEIKDRRRRRDELRTYRLERIRQTRRMLQAVVDRGTTLTLGDLAGSKAAQERIDAQEDASLYLVGDDAVALAYRDLLLLIANRMGQPLRVEDQIQSLEVMNRVAKALGDQEELARNGKALRQLSAATIAELSDVRAMATKMPLVDLQPSVDARLAGQILRFRRWLSRWPR